MNYFQLFELPVVIKVDKRELKTRFFELSRKHHPDYFAGTDKQDEALEISAELNKAYKVLTNEDETVRYILMEKGLLVEEEKAALPQAFLMEMMEVNEELEEADLENEEERNKIRQILDSLLEEIYEPVEALIENFTEDVPEKELLRLKEYYLKKKYLKRLAAQAGQKL